MEKQEIFQKIKNELNEKEQLVLASMLEGDSVINTSRNCGVPVNFAQSYRKTVYEVVGQFVDYGTDKNKKQQILIDFLQGYEQGTSEKNKTDNDRLDTLPYIQIAQQEIEAGKSLAVLKNHICKILNISKEFSSEEVIKTLEHWKRSDEEFAQLVNKNSDLSRQVKDLKNIVCKFTKDCSGDSLKKEFETPNYLVFNPKHGQPNRVYKNYQTALEDAKKVAKKEQQPVYILYIDTLVVPQCSFEVHDVLKSGISERYLSDVVSLDEIPF